jgi:flagellar basal-body rod modification protein FlgD
MKIDSTVSNASAIETGKDPDENGALDKQAFLELLVTQLRYQNPVNPMSNEEMIAQSAQFSSLEQMQNLNSNVKSLIQIQESSGKAAALNLIGKHVIIEDSTLSLTGQSSVELHYSLPEDANVTVNIYDASEHLVTTIEVGEQLAGEYGLVWDGLDSDGVRLPDGEYTYEVSAVDADGKEVGASQTVTGIVDGIIFGNEPYVSIGSLRAPLWAVTEVSPDQLLEESLNEDD